MSLYEALSAIACAGYLAFSALAWQRSGQSRIAAVLAVLLLDVFAWNFAELAHGLSHARAWALVDRFFASLMPALGLHVVALFVGKSKALERYILGGYVAVVSLALAATFWPLAYGLWWRSLLAAAAGSMAPALWLLVAHERRSVDVTERARTRLVLIAIGFATVVGSSDLWLDKIGLPRLRLSNLGMFVALGLFATATLRLELLGKALPVRLVSYAAASGGVGVLVYLFTLHYLDGPGAPPALGAVSLTVLGLITWRELGRIRAAHRAQTEQLMLYGRWAEQLAHDLGNPLATLKGALQFLTEEHRAGRSLDASAEYLSLMLEQCDRLQQNVLSYRRLARVDPVFSRAHVNDVVTRILGLQGIARPGIEIHPELGEGLPACSLDVDLVATALENLLQNACEALTEGGNVRVRTELLQGDLGGCIRLSVEDDGPGIEPRLAERVTEAFVTTKPGGSGLGLAFAARVAKAHGGKLELATVLGRGTVASLRFPIA